jgi:predicted acetyltransferase
VNRISEDHLQLIEPTEALCEAFGKLIQEFHAAGEIEQPPGSCWKDEDDFATFIRRARDYAEGENLPDGWVPDSAYWLVRGKRILGVCDVRHRLTEALRDFGGHIGYSIRPSRRGKGYGTAMLGLALEKARELGITRVLITCGKGNVASQRVIQKNGGVLDSESYSEQAGRVTQRYWIEL